MPHQKSLIHSKGYLQISTFKHQEIERNNPIGIYVIWGTKRG